MVLSVKLLTLITFPILQGTPYGNSRRTETLAIGLCARSLLH